MRHSSSRVRLRQAKAVHHLRRPLFQHRLRRAVTRAASNCPPNIFFCPTITRWCLCRPVVTVAVTQHCLSRRRPRPARRPSAPVLRVLSRRHWATPSTPSPTCLTFSKDRHLFRLPRSVACTFYLLAICFDYSDIRLIPKTPVQCSIKNLFAST